MYWPTLTREYLSTNHVPLTAGTLAYNPMYICGPIKLEILSVNLQTLRCKLLVVLYTCGTLIPWYDY